MRWSLAIAVLAAACDGSTGSECSPDCASGSVCRYAACVPLPMACAANADCRGDDYCDNKECLPWGIGPGGTSDPRCHTDSLPGVYFPGVQCQWLGPPVGDGFPMHVNVLATPMVAALDPHGTPSIVFTSYNFNDQHGGESCSGNSTSYFGVIRIIDGQTCAQQATIATPSVIGAASVAIADLGGADATPEIVAARSQGGLVAFTRTPSGWTVLWETEPPYPVTPCDWAGPSIHDLDDDGKPEVIFYGAVYNGQTGATIDQSIAGSVDSTAVGYVPVVVDIDGDGVPDLITGNEIYAWDKANRKWAVKHALPGANGHVAVGDFGTFPASKQDDRSHTDGIAEVVVVYQSIVHVFTVGGREVFTATLAGAVANQPGGGLPVLADFDGDGRLEIGVAGPTGYTVLDLDCRGAVDPSTCASRSSDGVLWATTEPPTATDLRGSSAFDFDGDGRAEVAYSDRCFSRVHDGLTGKVLYSRPRTSCTWYENPVIADTDGDYDAELVITSNNNCSAITTCPAIDPMFDGVACTDDSDCPSRSPTAMSCGRDQPGDTLGRCRCSQSQDCGDGFTCADPIAGPSPVGKVCRAAHAATPTTGVQVIADAVDRWASARPIWNQHAYSVTNVDDAGAIPRTSLWLRNWTQPGLNNFRQGAHRDTTTPGARPDLTVKQAKVTCDASAPTVSAEVCNRGSAPVGPGVPVSVYASTTPTKLRCQGQTTALLAPGACATVSCAWNGPTGDGAVAVDDRGDGSGMARECREDNNLLAIRVTCP